MNKKQKNIKRVFDVFFSIIALLLSGFVIIILLFVSRILFKEKGLFTQKRIGYKGIPFTIFKIKSISSSNTKSSISLKYGAFIRQTKLDELPQLFNVLKGDMSIVGPRPDLPGFADKLKGSDLIILSIKPGITGPASLYFKNEEKLLNSIENPKQYNLKVIWPKKIEINKNYIKQYSFIKDLYYISKSFF